MPDRPAPDHSPGRELEPLVRRCLADEDRAWAELLGRFERLIYAVIRRIGFRDPAGADIYQRVALALYEKLGTVRDLDYLARWIITTTKRECFSERRREQRDRRYSAVLLAEAQEGPEPELLDVEVERLIDAARVTAEVESLSPGCRELLTLLYLRRDPLSFTEVAARLGVPPGSILMNRASCLAELRRRLFARQALGLEIPGSAPRRRPKRPTRIRKTT